MKIMHHLLRENRLTKELIKEFARNSHSATHTVFVK